MTVRRRLAAAIGALSLVAGCRAPAHPAPDPGRPVTDAAGLLDWMAAHRDHVGLAVLADGSPVVALNDAAMFPLASVMKVVTLVTYADAVADGVLRTDQPVPLATIDRWYLPGTDGGAHQSALADWTDRNVVRSGAVPLAEVAWAMTRWSDNAAADELLRRVGGPAATERTARRYGMAAQQPVRPTYGDMVAWLTEPDGWAARPPAGRVARSQSLAHSVPQARARELALPDVATQRRLAATWVAGAPGEWARLMTGVARGDLLRPAAAAAVKAALEWPILASPENASTFARYGTKGGSLPGVATDASYVQVHGGPTVAVALFLRDLPEDVDAALRASYANQRFVQRLAADPGFRAEVARRLGG